MYSGEMKIFLISLQSSTIFLLQCSLEYGVESVGKKFGCLNPLKNNNPKSHENS